MSGYMNSQEIVDAQVRLSKIENQISELKELMETAPKRWQYGFNLCRAEDEIREKYLQPGIDANNYNQYMAHNKLYHDMLSSHRSRYGNGLDIMEEWQHKSAYVTSGRAAQQLTILEGQKTAIQQELDGYYDDYQEDEMPKIRKFATSWQILKT